VLAALAGRAGTQAQQLKPAPAPLMAVQVQPVVPDEQLEQWVFQQEGNAAKARQRLDALLALQVEHIDRECQLTDAQKAKLRLAGRGDIKRFFDRYEGVKQKFQLLKHDEQRAQEIWQDIGPLQTSLQAGLFCEDSLLLKSLPNTLTGEQLARYDATTRERRAFGHRASIELAVSTLEQGMPLREAQRRELIDLLVNHTRPPRQASRFDYYVTMVQLARFPEEKLKPLFDAAQWKVVERQLTQYKGIEASLRQSGQWPEEDDEAARAGGRPAVQK
jgi:hypothetical protein